MATYALDARPRTLTGRHAAQLRREGAVPAVIYGHQQDSLAIEADVKSVERLWHRAGKTTLIDLTVEGHQPRKVLFREVQYHPRSGQCIHADFFAPNLRVKTIADVPVVLHGEAPAEAQKLGQVLQTATTVRVESLPTDLPHQLVLDVSALVDADAMLTAGDLVIPAGVTLLTDVAEVLVKISVKRVRDVEEEEAEAAEHAAEAGEAAAGEAPAATDGEQESS